MNVSECAESPIGTVKEDDSRRGAEAQRVREKKNGTIKGHNRGWSYLFFFIILQLSIVNLRFFLLSTPNAECRTPNRRMLKLICVLPGSGQIFQFAFSRHVLALPIFAKVKL